jgi:hypothetical protein
MALVWQPDELQSPVALDTIGVLFGQPDARTVNGGVSVVVE